MERAKCSLSGGVGAAIDKTDLGDGILNGARNGAIGAASQSIGLIAAFGATRQLTAGQAEYITKIQKGENFKGSYNVRKGGIYQGLFSAHVTWGNTIVAFSDKKPEIYGHPATFGGNFWGVRN